MPQRRNPTFVLLAILQAPLMVGCDVIFPYAHESPTRDIRDGAGDGAGDVGHYDLRIGAGDSSRGADLTRGDQRSALDTASLLPLDHLLASYRFDDSLVDASGHLRNLAGTTVTYAAGLHQRALKSTAQSSVQSAASCNQEPPVLLVSVDLWFQPAALPTGAKRAMLFDRDGYYGAMIFADGSVTCVANATAVTATGAAVVGKWTHLACVIDGSSQYIYINGVRDAAGTGTTPYQASTHCIAVGQDIPSYGDRFNGLIDDLHTWDVPLSAAQVQATMTFSK